MLHYCQHQVLSPHPRFHFLVRHWILFVGPYMFSLSIITFSWFFSAPCRCQIFNRNLMIAITYQVFTITSHIMLKIKQMRSIFHRLRYWDSKKLTNSAKVRQMMWHNLYVLPWYHSFIHHFLLDRSHARCLWHTGNGRQTARVPSLLELATIQRRMNKQTKPK